MKKAIPFLAVSLLLSASLQMNAIHAESDNSTVRILFTEDLNDSIVSWTDTDGTVYGGYSRLKTLIDQNRTDNSILVDGGDFSTGTYFELLNTSSSPDLNLMKTMGYDAVALGEEDFSTGVSNLKSMLEVSDGPQLVNSNISFGDKKSAKALQSIWKDKGTASTIVEKNGVKIGIFSVLGTEEAEGNTGSVSFTDEIAASREAVSDLNDNGADVIVCLAHTGMAAARKIADKVDGINVMTVGHTYGETDKSFEEPVTEGDTVIVSAGSDGKYLGILDYDYKNKSVSSYSLNKVTADIAENADINTAVSGYQQSLQTQYLDPYGLNSDRTIATNTINFTDINDETDVYAGNNTADLISDAYAYAYYNWYDTWYAGWKADRSTRLEKAKEAAASADAGTATATPDGTDTEATASAAATSSADAEVEAITNETPSVKKTAIGIAEKDQIRGTLSAGDVTVQNIYKLTDAGAGTDGTPGTSLGVYFLKGSDLRNLAEYDATVCRNDDTDKILYFSGLRYDYADWRGDYNHVEDVYINATQGYYIPVDNDTYYPVVMNLKVARTLMNISSKTDGKLSVSLYDEDGTAVTDISSRVMKNSDSLEVKEYSAIAEYMQQFERTDNTPAVPADYTNSRKFKQQDTEFSLTGMFKNTSSNAWKHYAMIAVLIAAVLIGLRILRTVAARRQNG
jgi:2',3'-cyclic-nucleotide 2'-phosphodiesterase (5'-nucleotidase family)